MSARKVDLDTRKNPLLIWAGSAILAIAASTALSGAFDKEGDGNDPFLAELGNIGMLVALAVLLVVGVVAAVRAVRR